MSTKGRLEAGLKRERILKANEQYRISDERCDTAQNVCEKHINVFKYSNHDIDEGNGEHEIQLRRAKVLTNRKTGELMKVLSVEENAG